MTDNETIAAILAAGMLPPVAAPVTGPGGGVDAPDQQRLLVAVMHAVGLYRSVLEGLAVTAKAPNGSANFAANGNRHNGFAASRPVAPSQAARPERLRPRSSVEPVTVPDWDWS
jgi:hypothetical protein